MAWRLPDKYVVFSPTPIIVLLTSFQLNELPLEPGLINYYFNKPLDLGQLRSDLRRISNKKLANEGAGLLLSRSIWSEWVDLAH